MSELYSNEKLLSMKDSNGNVPELYIVCCRAQGRDKTFSFTKKLFDDFQNDGSKFVLLCRTKSELGCIADGMMKGMLNAKYPGWSVYEKVMMRGCYSMIMATYGKNEEKVTLHCGYVIPLNTAYMIKNISSMFVDATQGYMDEFEPENGRTYVPNEVDKFISVHGSMTRGDGKSGRHFPIYMSSNTISITNPYFVALGLTNKIQENTKFYCEKGFCFLNEMKFNE